MSIFGAIRHAIFGDKGPLGGQFSGHAANTQSGHPQTTDAEPERPAAPAPQAPAAAPAPAPTPAATAPAAPATQPVDAEAAIARIAQEKGNPNLDWRHSIVDLMKLLDLDSSLDNRKQLATELGYTGAKDGSAEMNIWLHQAVMRELSQNGGAVPAGLRD